MALSRTESLARNLFRYYLPFLKVQYGIRPDWLKWPVTGNNLELDIYFPDIKVAVEIDGIQHGRPIMGMQKDFAAFEKQQARDLWKLEKCRSLGITLYKLTIFDLTERRFPDHYRAIISTGFQNTDRDSRLSGQLMKCLSNLPNTHAPRHLYAEAEQLSRQKFRPVNRPKKRQPGVIPLIKRLIGVA